MNNFPIVFGSIVATVVVAALLYDHATPHVSASGPAPPKASVIASKAPLPDNVTNANVASESPATPAADAPRGEASTSGPVSTSRPQATTATKAIKRPSKSVETQNPVDLNGNQSPSDTVTPSADQPAKPSAEPDSPT